MDKQSIRYDWYNPFYLLSLLKFNTKHKYLFNSAIGEIGLVVLSVQSNMLFNMESNEVITKVSVSSTTVNE